MPGSFGGMSPFAFQFGGGPRNLELITQSLNAARSAALDASTWSSTVSIENRSFARYLNRLWCTNARAQGQFDPTRTTDLLPRWERIYGVFPFPTDSDGDRRTRLTFKWQQASKEPWYQQIVDDLTSRMGQVFLGLSHLPSANGRAIFPGNNSASIVSGFTSLSGGSGYALAPTWVAVGGGGAGAFGTTTLGGGGNVNVVFISSGGFGYTSVPTIIFSSGNASVTAVISGGTNPNPYDISGTTTLGSSWVDWASGVSYIGVHIRRPAGMSNAAFQAAVNAGSVYLDGALPGWCQFGMFQTPGFVLDQANFGVASLAS